MGRNFWRVETWVRQCSPWAGSLGLPQDFTAFQSRFMAFQAWATGNKTRDQALLLTGSISHMNIGHEQLPLPLPLSSFFLLSLPSELLYLLHPDVHTSARFSPPHNAPLQSVAAFLPLPPISRLRKSFLIRPGNLEL